MPVLNSVGFLGSQSARSQLYLQQMTRHGLVPGFAVLLWPDGQRQAPVPEHVRRHAADRGFDLDADIRELVREAGIPHCVLPCGDPNAPEVVEAVRKMDADVIIYSGPGGAILRQPLLETGKQFLHVHPGDVPEYRGSTTVYYSLLRENGLAASAIYLEARIDAGPVLMRRHFEPPEDRTVIDIFHDPFIRSELLLDVLRLYAEGREPITEHQSPDAGETYYIIHPVLKHLAILSDK